MEPVGPYGDVDIVIGAAGGMEAYLLDVYHAQAVLEVLDKEEEVLVGCGTPEGHRHRAYGLAGGADRRGAARAFGVGHRAERNPLERQAAGGGDMVDVDNEADVVDVVVEHALELLYVIRRDGVVYLPYLVPLALKVFCLVERLIERADLRLQRLGHLIGGVGVRAEEPYSGDY